VHWLILLLNLALLNARLLLVAILYTILRLFCRGDDMDAYVIVLMYWSIRWIRNQIEAKP